MSKDIVEKNIRRTALQRIGHTLCLLLPICNAFLGKFLAPVIWSHFSEKEIPELFNFASSLILFLITAIIIFVTTRNTNTIIRMRIHSDNKKD